MQDKKKKDEEDDSWGEDEEEDKYEAGKGENQLINLQRMATDQTNKTATNKATNSKSITPITVDEQPFIQ